jgi:hypothetical protein
VRHNVRKFDMSNTNRNKRDVVVPEFTTPPVEIPEVTDDDGRIVSPGRTVSGRTHPGRTIPGDRR